MTVATGDQHDVSSLEQLRQRTRTLANAIGILVLAGVVILVVGTQAHVAAIAGGLVVNLLAFWVAARRLQPIAVSPPFIFAAYLTLIAIAGYLFSNALVGSGGTGGV